MVNTSNGAADHLSFCVVIPTKNRRDDLVSAVTAVLAQTHPVDELIIVDQSTTDAAGDAIDALLSHHHKITYKYIFDNALTGLTAAKNAAVRLSVSDIICFIDDDIVLEKNFIQVIGDVFKQRPDLSGVGGVAQLPQRKHGRLRRWIAPIFLCGPFFDVRVLLQYNYKVKGDIISSRFLSGGLSALRRELFEHIQFNESLPGASPVEDLDFYSRASQFKFAIAPKAVALHHMSLAGREGLRDRFELKCAGFAHIFYHHIPKTPLNVFAFLWRNVGFVFDAAEGVLRYGSWEPFRGLVGGWRRSLLIKQEKH